MSTLIILQSAQCAVRTIFTVTVQSIPAHKRPVLDTVDSVIATYLPKQSASTVGMTVVHLFSLDEADKFTRMRGENKN
jgi:hypothetical protein